MNLKITIIFYFIFIMMIYLLNAYVILEPNFLKWDLKTREKMAGVVGFVTAITICLIIFFNETKKELKEDK